jgi:hypothetical protein
VKKIVLPVEFKKYFWDVDFDKLSENPNYRFILARILDWGGVFASKWVKENFDLSTVVDALINTSEVSPRSATFWGKIYKVSPGQMKCFQTLYQKTRKTLWPY